MYHLNPHVKSKATKVNLNTKIQCLTAVVTRHVFHLERNCSVDKKATGSFRFYLLSRSLVGCMQPTGSQRAGHDWATSLSLFTVYTNTIIRCVSNRWGSSTLPDNKGIYTWCSWLKCKSTTTQHYYSSLTSI